MSFLPILFANSLDQVQAWLTSMDVHVIVSHTEGRLMAQSMILINFTLFINQTSCNIILWKLIIIASSRQKQKCIINRKADTGH